VKRREVPEHLRVPWNVRDVVVLAVSWFALQILMGVGLKLLAPHVPAVAAFLAAAVNGDVGASFALDVVGMAIGLGIVAGYLHKYGVGWSALGWRRASIWQTVKYLTVVLIAFVYLANLAFLVVKMLVPGFNADQPQTNEFTGAVNTHRSLALLALVVLPPIFEETVFRGFMFPALSKRAGIVWGAVISSAIFGLAHGQPNLFVYTFPLGLFLCFMYTRLGSIWPGILLHMINNYLAFLSISAK
jgi:membrane protease YdiL (CAAX protease family)